MHASSTFAAALVALAPAVHAGTAFIKNQCDYPVYLFPVAGGDFEGPIELDAKTGSYSQEYKTFSFGGMSLKLSKTKECVNITQFEYTLAPALGKVFYDISNVDCYNKGNGPCPFENDGLHMASSGSGCESVTCDAGDMQCKNAYNLAKDDWATKGCVPSADTTLYLCSTSASGSSGDDDSNDNDDDNDDEGDDNDNGNGGPIASAISAVSSLVQPSPTPSPVHSFSALPLSLGSNHNVQAAAVPTSAPSVAASSSAPAPPASTPSPTTLATSVKSAQPLSAVSSAAPEPTAPPANVVYTTQIDYTTQWATKWVSARSEHEDFHHRAKPRSPHAHARRHQHREQE